jgi:hypothetical protein
MMQSPIEDGERINRTFRTGIIAMKKFRLALCATAVLLTFTAHALSEEPQKVTVCQLQKYPPAFDHKLVELEAFVSWGFEDFSLFDPRCFIYPLIWLEYGGKVNSGTVYLGAGSNQRQREKELVVQNIPISLVDDDLFKKFDERIHHFGLPGHGTLTRARLVGRFFAGRKETYPSGESAWGGFGHFGCCTLLAIEQIKDASFEDRPGLDPYGVPQPLIAGFSKLTTTYHFLTPEDISKFDLESQSKAEDGSRSWAFDDPRRVALDLIQQDGRGKLVDPSRLRTVHRRTASMEYEMKLPGAGKEYSVTVSRPYWLSFYARDPKRVAWVVTYATVTTTRKNTSKPRPELPALKSPISPPPVSSYPP